jgi:hypothetical protein
MQSPEPQFLDTVAALIRARIAARSACDEFIPQAPKVQPDKPVVVGERHPYNVINGFNAMSTQTRGSPLPEATLSLPETPPAALSQVPIPCPGFNGHKPRFDEGEKRLGVSVVNKAGSAGMEMGLPCSKAVCSLPELVPSMPSQALAPRPGFNGHKPSSSFLEGEGRLAKLAINKINKPSATHSPEPETAFVPFIPKPAVTLRAPVPCPSLCPPRKPPYTIGATLGPTVVSARGGKKEGLYAPEPLGTLNVHLSGSMLDEWLLWKPPDVKEMRRHASHVVTLVISETSAAHSPKPITALSPCTSKPAAASQALTPLLRDTAAICQSVSLLPAQPARCAEALSPPRLTWEMGLVVPWKLPLARKRKRCASIINNKNKEMSAVRSPENDTVLIQAAY